MSALTKRSLAVISVLATFTPKDARKAVALTITLLFLLASSPVMLARGNNIGDEVANPNLDFWPPTNSTLTQAIVDFQNTSIYGRPLFANTTTGDVYYSTAPAHLGFGVLYRSNGSYQVLNASIGYTPYSDWIYNGVVCPDGGILISVYGEKVVLRSTDGGRHFSTVMTTRAGAIWHFALRSSAVFAVEYGPAAPIGDAADLWRSTDNGKSGSWSVVYQTPQTTSIFNHWHTVYVDPWTNYVYATNGDGQMWIHRSLTGVTWGAWELGLRATSIVASPDKIFFGDDAWSRVVAYNKTTKKWSEHYMTNIARHGPIYAMERGEEGVLYARSMCEGQQNRIAGLYVSPDDGERWSFVLNMTGIPHTDTGDNGWFDQHLFSDGYGRIYFGFANPTANTADRGKVWVWSMKDLSRQDAYALDGSYASPVTDEAMTYQPSNAAFDGQTGYIELGQNVLEDAVLNVTGTRFENLAYNGSVPSLLDFNKTWGYTGWAKNPDAGQANNLSVMATTARYTSAPYSAMIRGLNSSVSHGDVRFTKDLSSPGTYKYPKAGETVTVSFYASVDQATLLKNTTANWSAYVQAYANFLYSDFTATSRYVLGNAAFYDNQSYAANRGNQTDGWQRCWRQWEIPAGKQLRYIILQIHVVGIITLYVDDIQFINSTGLTPVMEGTGFVNETSEAINFTIDGTTYDIGDLEDGEMVSVPLTGKVLAGLVPFGVTVDGSRQCLWTIWGKKKACSADALIEYDGAAVALSRAYGNTSLVVWNDATIDAPTFLNRSAVSADPVLAVDTDAGAVNMTFAVWSYDEMTFTVNASRSTTVTISLSNLAAGDQYWVTRDGGGLSTVTADANGTLTFELEGAAVLETVSMERTTLFSDIFGLMGVYVLILVVGAMVSMVAIFRRG